MLDNINGSIFLGFFKMAAASPAFLVTSTKTAVKTKLHTARCLFYAITFCTYGIIKKLVPASALTGLFIETLIISVPSAIYVLYLISTGESAVY